LIITKTSFDQGHSGPPGELTRLTCSHIDCGGETRSKFSTRLLIRVHL